jgi:acetyl-CoA carboxylase biotin carboxyl carrier protein
MIDIEKLRELVGLMKDADLTEVDIAMGEDSVTIRRGSATQVVYQTAHSAPQMMAMPSHAPSAPAHHAEAPAPAKDAKPAPAAHADHIESPMVGTLYLAANPNSPPFVKVGQNVTPDTVVCIIEAMKVFNEIKAEKSGVIEGILAKNGQAVEFGQKLFGIKPA